MNAALGFLLIFFCCAAALPSPASAAFSLKIALAQQNNEARLAMLQPDKVVAAMGLQPGMSVLDIGAGAGVFTFRLARALQGTGTVYATDTVPEFVDYLKKESLAQGLKNVVVAKVQRTGLDPFYSRQTYDLILLSGFYYRFTDPGSYFRQLRPLLKDGGRLIIIQPVNEEFFLPQAFKDEEVNAAVAVLRAAGPGHPVYRRLSSVTTGLIKSDKAAAMAEFKALLARDLEAMLADPSFFPDMAAFYRAVDDPSPGVALNKMKLGNNELVRWLLGRLDDADAFARDAASLSADEKKMINRLNGILIRNFLKLEKPFAKIRGHYIAESPSMLRTLTRAGYKPVERSPLLPYELILEFKKD
ncbi:MAG: class I SAM-dependent methyltransferase [Candidatus Omnitrophota bacterium]